jgi:hypothetical protein
LSAMRLVWEVGAGDVVRDLERCEDGDGDVGLLDVALERSSAIGVDLEGTLAVRCDGSSEYVFGGW